MTEERALFYFKLCIQVFFVCVLIFFIWVDYAEWYDVKYLGKAGMYDIGCDCPATDFKAYTSEATFIRYRFIGFTSSACILLTFILAFIFKWRIVKFICGAAFILIFISLMGYQS